MDRFTKAAGSVAALGALALGGSALADAASNTATPSTSSQSSTAQSSPSQSSTPPAGPQVGPHGRHVGANGNEEQALSSDVAKKVAAAALAKVKGTVERTETDADHGSPYEAHIRKSDGTEVEVQVGSDYTVSAVNEMGGAHP
ncbi:MAG: hypothetical protein ACJ77G_03900 [Solirubrobacteraceae bacterium]